MTPAEYMRRHGHADPLDAVDELLCERAELQRRWHECVHENALLWREIYRIRDGRSVMA